MLNQPRTIEPIRKVVTVPASTERAFELFTAGIGEWWPLATHSVGQDKAAGVAFGEGVGGDIVESLADGSTAVWGTVTRWEPPHLVACTWHAGTPVAQATHLEVTFTAGKPGETLVQLVHSGWELRPDGEQARSGYETGWDPVIASYARQAAAAGLPG
jgi:uncharacterized protein YndB with AHSA1/START domain